MLIAHWFSRAAQCDHSLWQSGFPPSIEGKWWYETLESSGLEDQFTFMYLELRNVQDEAIALAPCFVMNVPLEMFAPEPLIPFLRFISRFYPPLLHQRTFFVGSPCSDKGWIGLKNPKMTAEDKCTVFRSLHIEVLKKAAELKAPMRVWKDMPEAFTDTLKAISQEFKLFSVISFPGTELVLPASLTHRKEAYFASIKPSRRQKLRRTLRRAETANRLRIEVIASPSQVLLDQLFSLFWQTYENATTRFEKLNQHFFESIAHIETSRFIVLYPAAEQAQSGDHIGDHLSHGSALDPTVPVAFMLVYIDGPTLINKFIGINYSAPKEWFLYFRLWDACVDLAIQMGHHAIESGQTGYDAKISVGHRMIPLTNYCHHANPLLRWVYALVGKHITWESLDPELARISQDPDH